MLVFAEISPHLQHPFQKQKHFQGILKEALGRQRSVLEAGPVMQRYQIILFLQLINIQAVCFSLAFIFGYEGNIIFCTNQINNVYFRLTMQSSVAFPVRPRGQYGNDGRVGALSIEKMLKGYHNSATTFLEDEILFNEQCQFLKRQYEEYQFPNKIVVLSQYYQYHQELPRIFHEEMGRTIETYHQDVRNLEYQIVTKKMKQGSGQEETMTERDKRKPIDKIIKNIELSYYNFEKKDVKKGKDQRNKQITNNKNKKSMPTLPFHQHCPKNIQHPPKLMNQPKHTINHMAASVQPLKNKDSNKLSIKSKSKENLKKVSLNSSIEEGKNLSRSKSKSNLATLNAELVSKRHSVKPFQQVVLPQKTDKTKSNPTSLQKTSSHKNFLKKQQPKKVVKILQKLQQLKQNIGVKGMFKKVMQTKKVIKIAR